MHDPKLRRRLGLVPTPVVLLWGETARRSSTGARTPPHSPTVGSSRSRKPAISPTSSSPNRSSRRFIAALTRRRARPPGRPTQPVAASRTAVAQPWVDCGVVGTTRTGRRDPYRPQCDRQLAHSLPRDGYILAGPPLLADQPPA